MSIVMSPRLGSAVFFFFFFCCFFLCFFFALSAAFSPKTAAFAFKLTMSVI